MLPIDIYECDYEALAADPETEAPRLLAAAGLEWDPRCLDFHSTGKLAQTASYEQVRRPIHTERIDAWRRYESHLGPLVEALAAGS